MKFEDFIIIEIIKNNWSVFTAPPAQACKVHTRKCFLEQKPALEWITTVIKAYENRPADYYSLAPAFKWEIDDALKLGIWKEDMAGPLLETFKLKFTMG